MELTILGSGTYQPELDRHASSYLIKTGQQNLVFDFGRGVLDQLMKAGINYYDIDYIFISHMHADHCSELSPFLHIALAEPEKGKFRQKDITIYGPKGLKKTVKNILEAFGLQKSRPRYKVNIIELGDNDFVKNKNWLIKTYTTKHFPTIASLAYRLEVERKIIAYSGDTERCLGLEKACQSADLAIVEACWHKIKPLAGHLSAEKTAEIAKKAKVKKLILTHISPYYMKEYNIKELAQKYYKGPIIIAKDLMKIKI